MGSTFNLVVAACAAALASCAATSSDASSEAQLLDGQGMAIAYSGFRAGQHPDRGSGAINPSRGETLEDLGILVEAGFDFIRLYDSGMNSAMVLEVIEAERLPLRVLLGVWLDAEVSNHGGCPWLTEPIPEETLRANKAKNAAEVERSVALAKRYPAIVTAINVGNEALVEWNDHMVPLESVIGYVRRVRDSVDVAVTVADNYLWWIERGARLAAELDFIGVHTYPLWESKGIDEGLSYTVQNIEDVRAALPGVDIAVLEAGWATTAVEFGARAGEAQQARYFEELRAWGRETGTTVFFFEAFDEPWKGDPNSPAGAEKHWGLWDVERRPKAAVGGR